MASIEPFRKELDFLRKKSSSTIDYEELLSNLHPFSNAIRELGIYKIQAENAKKFKRNVSENSASVNLYRSMPKKKNLREQLKPIS